MSDTIDQVLRRTAALVYQPEGRTFSDVELKEFVNVAQQSVMLELAARGVTTLRAETTVTVTAGMTSLTTATTPALPSDFIQPIRLWELMGGQWTGMLMVKDHLPLNAVQTERLVWWDWRDDAIKFVGATVAVQVKIHYDARLEDFTMPRETIGLPDLVNILSYKAASIASAIANPEKVPFFDREAAHDLEKIVSLDVRANQSRPVRRKRRRFGIPRWRY